jgi:hypothetical protein
VNNKSNNSLKKDNLSNISNSSASLNKSNLTLFNISYKIKNLTNSSSVIITQSQNFTNETA